MVNVLSWNLEDLTEPPKCMERSMQGRMPDIVSITQLGPSSAEFAVLVTVLYLP